MSLLYKWVYLQPTLRQLQDRTGSSLNTLVHWTNLFRSHAIAGRPKLIGTPNETVQIDESYFRG